MRRFVLPVLLLAAVLIVQLTFLNGLRLPGGGVPDLVLVVVAAVGLAGGPVPGAIAGFAAGLCLDLAPPGSGILGEYALVFCIVGYVCGRFRPALARSALLPIVIAAAAAVLGEAMAAALGMALQPDQVTWTAVRQVLPSTLFYDIAISPFVLYLVLLATARLAVETTAAATAGQERLRRARAQAGSALSGHATAGRQGLAGSAGSAGSVAGNAVLLGLGGWLAGPPQSRRARRAAARRSLRLSARRAGDGWVGGSVMSRRLAGGRAPTDGALSHRSVSGLLGGGPHGAARLRSGVAGSAAGGQAPRSLPSRPVNLHLAGGRAGRPVVTGRGVSRGALASLGRRRSRRDGGFRPSVMPGGSAAGGQIRRVPLGAGAPARMRFGSPTRLPFPLHGAGLLADKRLRAGRRRDGVVGGGALTHVGSTGRKTAAPRFRIRVAGMPVGTAALAGRGPGSPSLDTFRRPAPRLRMRTRRGDGMLGGLVASGPRRHVGGRGGGRGRPATPRFRRRSLAGSRPMSGKRPRFRHRRWPVLSPLAARIRAVGGHGWRITGRRGGSR